MYNATVREKQQQQRAIKYLNRKNEATDMSFKKPHENPTKPSS